MQDVMSGGRLPRKIATHSVFLTHGFQIKQSTYFPIMEKILLLMTDFMFWVYGK